MPQDHAIIGISDHGGWAVLVTVTAAGKLLDRRRVELVDPDLPKIPHHSEAQSLPLDEAIALIHQVRASAERHAELALAAVAATVPGRVRGIALRQCPQLPATIAERIQDYRAHNVADWVMYRQALGAASATRGWAIHWFDPKSVFRGASEAFHIADFETYSLHIRKSIGPPWGQDQKLAMAAALCAANQADGSGASNAEETET